MTSYIIRRLLLVIPTLLGIMIINFSIVQFAPGGPVEQMIARMNGQNISATDNISGGTRDMQTAQSSASTESDAALQYRGAQGLDPDIIRDIEKLYGFDKPAHERFFLMMGNYLTFDFGDSFYRDAPVVNLIIEKLPVSISLGLWTTLLAYIVSIPLGIRKAVRDGSQFDSWTSTVVIIGNAIPGFLFAVLLIVVFAGSSYFDWFPLRGLVSDNWEQLNWFDKIKDYFWHLTLPIISMAIGGFATLTLLTKNSFLEEIHKLYVVTGRAKGLTEQRVLYGHVFRNAMIIVIAGFPAALVSILFTGSLLIEIIFSLDGLGLLGFEAALNRDYPIVFATVYIFTLIGLVLQIISDMVKTIIDPRIDFEGAR